MESKDLTNKELLIRIDERQQGLTHKIEDICNKMEGKVDIEDFKPYKVKTEALWDNQNKAIGWVIAGATGGGLVQLAGILVTKVFAQF